jgi:hypothetical protein
LTGANGTVTGTNVNATNQSASGEPAGENSVWYRWTPPSNGTAHFNIGMDWLTIDVFTGSTIGGLTHVATSSGSPSAVTWTAVEGTTYRIRLYQKHTDSGLSFTLDALDRDTTATAQHDPAERRRTLVDGYASIRLRR